MQARVQCKIPNARNAVYHEGKRAWSAPTEDHKAIGYFNHLPNRCASTIRERRGGETAAGRGPPGGPRTHQAQRSGNEPGSLGTPSAHGRPRGGAPPTKATQHATSGGKPPRKHPDHDARYPTTRPTGAEKQRHAITLHTTKKKSASRPTVTGGRFHQRHSSLPGYWPRGGSSTSAPRARGGAGPAGGPPPHPPANPGPRWGAGHYNYQRQLQ